MPDHETVGFTNNDLDQILEHGLSIEEAIRQMTIFSKGIPKTFLDRPAVVGDGIVRLTALEFQVAADFFDQHKNGLKLKKFVPASGAASRMFKFMSVFLKEFDVSNDTINSYINRHKATDLSIFMAAREKFPFFEAVNSRLDESYTDGEIREKDRRSFEFIKMMLDENEFDFANKPKGILPFHRYADRIATPVEEHLREGARYASSDGISNLHFTISEGHRQGFEEIVSKVKPAIEQRTGIDIKINFSYQHQSTDTIAVDMDNKPFRDKEGNLVFRPGGHGALIRNLSEIDADIVFIKNIDNVIQNHDAIITLYKKALGGLLLELQQEVFSLLNQIEAGNANEAFAEEAISFLKKKLHVTIPPDFGKYTRENKIDFIFEKLNRPLRICGMVKNEGEPGGGPFWVVGQQGNVSLQIVETSQVEMRDPQQTAIVEKSTHFNPVDIVCSVKDYKGKKFNLPDFVDHERGFIVQKQKDGRDLKGYELPGLWNGAMAKWNTVFVEVPLVTFNPVKTVNDLLKPAHQPQ
ncbi:DUF4301 family protein [Flavobacterium silvaticum]|uniref:DUF4301 family protein n=1 Tax=Flavobacterium silvaticum TaxID=1852020 RepID=A0A972JGN1_9FLAO|nr:DUF4301 family protein [Flavobacterium silvaticum]NMH27045.1 DUF4301 family protein [Flavobacterium silvaticum]